MLKPDTIVVLYVKNAQANANSFWNDLALLSYLFTHQKQLRECRVCFVLLQRSVRCPGKEIMSLKSLSIPHSSHILCASSTRTSYESKKLPESQNMAAQHARIKAVFEGAEKAANRKGNAAATVAFIKARVAVDQMPKTPATTRLMHRLGIGAHEETRTAKIDRMQSLYNEGVLGRDPDLKKERRGWRKPALLEWFHTGAARAMHAGAGEAMHKVHAVGEKIAINQGLGYAPQASVSAYLRIATEVLQILLNDGGKPKLPPNVTTNAASLKNAGKEFKAVTEALTQANAHLRAKTDAASAVDASAGALDDLREQIEKVKQEKARIGEPDKQYKYRFVAFKRQYMGKRWSAAVSGVVGSVGTPLKAVVPVASRAIKAAAIPAQVVASYFDYIKMQTYTLRAAAKKVDLSCLLKKDSRNKPLDQITEADIDIASASRFYDEQPQLIIAATREIYRHKLAELNYQKLALEEGLAHEDKPARRFAMFRRGSDRHAPREKKENELREVNEKLEKLKTQIGHFERGEAEQIDPEGRIGKALTNPWYFFRKGTNAVFFNKVGEFWAQNNQRIFNSYNPFVSIGEAAVAADILSAAHGPGFVAEGLGLQGASPHADVQQAAAALTGAQLLAGVNSAVTVIAARDHKDIVDRKRLATPAWIAKGESVKPGTRESELEDALKKGLLSRSKKKRIEKAIADVDSQPLESRQRKKADRVLTEWEVRKEEVKTLADEINRKWIFDDLVGKDGKPIVIDLRTSAACYRKYMPLLQRIWIPLKSIPQGMLHSVTLLKDAVQARRARGQVHKEVEESDRLMALARAVLEKKVPPALSLNLEQGPEQNFNLASFASILKETNLSPPSGAVKKLDELTASPIWPQSPSEDLESRPFSTQDFWHRSTPESPARLSAADYREYSAAILENLRNFNEDALTGLDGANSKRASEDLTQLHQSACQVQLLARFNTVRSLLTIGDDTHRDWERTDAQLNDVLEILARLRNCLAEQKQGGTTG